MSPLWKARLRQGYGAAGADMSGHSKYLFAARHLRHNGNIDSRTF